MGGRGSSSAGSGRLGAEAHKAAQFEIVQANNPMRDDYHTGIRSVSDIRTFAEAVEEYEAGYTPDYTERDAERALQRGSITVYSSHPIQQGTFVTPSRMEAESYAGSGRVYSKTVDLSEVAWIDNLEGQYAKVR